jgi:thioredoxin reductase (NADPH)
MSTNLNDSTKASVIDDQACAVLEKPTFSKTEPQVEPSVLAIPEHLYDVAIIGAGPAALTAAIYTARDDLKTVVIEKGVTGGIPATIDIIENYPGFPDGIAGLELAEKLTAQAEKFGAKIELAEVTAIGSSKGIFCLTSSDGKFFAKTILIATGSDHKKLGIPGENEYYARGVHYCATCDGALYKGKNLVVVGGGNSAVQEALFLTRYATQIDLLVRSTFKADDILIKQLSENPKIKVHLHTVTESINGNDNSVTGVLGKNLNTNEPVEILTDGVFIFAGQQPNSAFLDGSAVVLDEAGFIHTDNHYQTSTKGVFAAGDVRSGATMQIACAAGEGAAAALCIREYLQHLPSIDLNLTR